MRKLLAALLLLLFVPTTINAGSDESATWMARFDVDSLTVTYGVLKGQNGNPYGGGIKGVGKIRTTGSATAVVAVDTANTAPFTELVAGDVIEVRQPDGTVDIRYIDVRTDADNITVDTNVNWENGGAGFDFVYYKFSTCTNTTCGWIDISKYESFVVEVGLERSDLATGIEFLVECKGEGMGAQPKQVFPTTAGTRQAIASAGAGTTTGRYVVTVDNDGFASCRLGVVRVGADTADVVNATTELFDASVTGALRAH